MGQGDGPSRTRVVKRDDVAGSIPGMPEWRAVRRAQFRPRPAPIWGSPYIIDGVSMGSFFWRRVEICWEPSPHRRHVRWGSSISARSLMQDMCFRKDPPGLVRASFLCIQAPRRAGLSSQARPPLFGGQVVAEGTQEAHGCVARGLAPWVAIARPGLDQRVPASSRGCSSVRLRPSPSSAQVTPATGMRPFGVRSDLGYCGLLSPWATLALFSLPGRLPRMGM